MNKNANRAPGESQARKTETDPAVLLLLQALKPTVEASGAAGTMLLICDEAGNVETLFHVRTDLQTQAGGFYVYSRLAEVAGHLAMRGMTQLVNSVRAGAAAAHREGVLDQAMQLVAGNQRLDG